MYKAISNVLLLLVVIMIAVTAFSMFSGKDELLPYIQIIFALFLVTWGILEYKVEGKKLSYLYFVLAFIVIMLAFNNFFNQ